MTTDENSIVIGTETEYVLYQVSRPSLWTPTETVWRRRLSAAELRQVILSLPEFNHVRESAPSEITIGPGFFIHTGGRIYVDGQFLEYATPEAVSARDATLLELQGSRVVNEAADTFASRNGLEIEVLKSLSTWEGGGEVGYHENYGLPHKQYFELFHQNFWPKQIVSRALIPFLVTRAIFAGAGDVVLDKANNESHFELSQRARYIDTVFNYSSVVKRPILHLKRPDLTDSHLRIQITCGDVNVIDYATFCKLGSTAVVLICLAQGFLRKLDLQIRSPVEAFRAMSRDWQSSFELDDGRRLRAIDIQEAISESVWAVQDRVSWPLRFDWQAAMARWREVLGLLRREHYA
jgi:Pup amidohydrolase